VVRAELDQMVQVQYAEPDRPMLHCTHTAIASMEVRVRSSVASGRQVLRGNGTRAYPHFHRRDRGVRAVQHRPIRLRVLHLHHLVELGAHHPVDRQPRILRGEVQAGGAGRDEVSGIQAGPRSDGPSRESGR